MLWHCQPVHSRLFGGAQGSPARQDGVRAHNMALVLQHVAQAAGSAPSRATVAAGTGLTRATVSTLVDDLLAGGLVIEVDPAPRNGAGRPAAGLALAPHGPVGLGLEVNVDYLAAAAVDFTGAVLHRVVRHADQRPAGAERTLEQLGDLAGEVRRSAEGEGLPLAGAALAVPGLVTADGLVKVAPNLDWHDVDATALLRRSAALAELPIAVDNEANLAALGELHAGPPTASFVYISGEVGIGAGLVLEGVLYRGVRGLSGEIGHVAVQPDGPRCRCGARGCLEQYAGQEAILRAAGIADDGVAGAALATLATRAEQGEPAAVAALFDAGTALGTVISAVVNLLDVDTIVLGGNYVPLLAFLRGGIEGEITGRVLTAGWRPVTVQASALGPLAAVIGAGGCVVRGVREDPAGWLSRN